MNIDQRNQIKEYCSQFNTGKLLEAIYVHYPDNNLWATTMIDIYSIENIVQLLPRIFDRTSEGVNGEDYVVYPWDHHHPILGNNNLGNHFSHLIACINEKKNPSEFHQSITWLIKYLLDFNLWNKQNLKINTSELEESKIKLDALTEKVKRELLSLEGLRNDLKTEKETLVSTKTTIEQLIEAKKEELRVITETLTTVTNQKTEVDNTLKSVEKTDAEIRVIQKNHNDQFENLKTQKENQEKEFKIQAEKLQEEITALKLVLENGDSKVKYFQSLEQFIKEKQAEIIELGGLAAGGALGGTFGLREKKLSDGMLFWKIAVPSMTVISMAWVVIVFTCLASKTGIVWVDLILNLAKTLPAFILMGFVFKQYNKERNLQEEYAFKASVAHTIKAYSDLLKGEDKSENVSRQEMLKDAVKQVQTAPKLYSSEGGKVFSFSTKYLADTVKNLNDTLKNLNPKG